MILGDQIYLAALDVENADTFARWFNDPETNRWMLSGHLPISLDQEKETLAKMVKDDSLRAFQIHVREDDRLIGLVSLMKIDMRHRCADLGIVVGEGEARGKGYGRDAIVTCLRAGFDVMGLHSIGIFCFEGNETGQHLYRSIGFVEQGRIRDDAYLCGRFWDAIMFDMLEDEFRERYGTWEGA